MRVGHFDAVATRYALALTGPLDLLAVTHIDRLRDMPEWKIATHYQYRGNLDQLTDFFTVQGGGLSDIRRSEQPDLERQAQLTLRLQRCVPQYEVQRTSDATTAVEADVLSYLA